ncbi:MAG: hypothetical protein IPK64_16310 [bacterium]|nr:hypothetical protein [bacterium]
MAVCSHLEDYATQFEAVEAAYRQCVARVDAVLADGPGDGRAGALAGALGDWRAQDSRLRELLLELVKAGRVRVPRRLVAAGARRHAVRPQGSIICSTCRRTLPRLHYAEWKFAHNGTVTFRGRELPGGHPATV